MRGTFGWFHLTKIVTLSSALSLGAVSCSSKKKDSSSTSSSSSATSSDSSGTTDGTTGGTTGGTTATDTTVNIVGSLSLTSDTSSASLRLTADPAYKLKCVTADITDMKACLGDITSGAFDLSCEGFKGKKFGCFIGELDTDGTSLNILGMLTSDQLAASDSTDKIVMGITFDATTGIASVTSFEAQKETGEVDTEAAKVAASVSTELKNLAIESGTYDFNFIDLGRNDAAKGNFKETDITDNAGHKERYYIAFTAAGEEKAPRIELWKSEADRTACLVNDVLTYSISDGTNNLSIDAQSTFETVYAAIVANGWAAQAALDRIEKAGESIQQKEDSKAAEMAQMFGTQDFCPVLIQKLLDGYTASTLKTEHGFSRCDNLTFDTGNDQLNEQLAQDGPPMDWCVNYKNASTDEEKTKFKDQFVMECNLNVKGGGNQEELWAKRDLVEPFLRSLGEARHQAGSSQFDNFKKIWASMDFDGIVTRVEANTQTQDDDDQLSALCISLKDVWYDRQRLEVACANIGTANPKLAFGGQQLTGRKFLASLFKSGSQPRQELERRACDGEWNFDFKNISIDDVNGTALSTFFSKLAPNVPGMQNNNGMVTKVEDGDTYTGIVNPVLTFLLGDGDTVQPKVFGCTAVQLESQKQWMAQMAECQDLANISNPQCAGAMPQGEGQSFDPAQQMATQLYHTLKDAKKSLLIREVNLKDPNNNSINPFETCEADKNCAEALSELNALSTSILNIINASPEQTAWLLNDLCGLNGQAINSNGGFTLGTDTALQCGGAVPQDKFYSHMFGMMGGGEATFPNQWEGDQRSALDRLGDLEQRISFFVGNEAARFDTSYTDKLLLISKNSACLPDATLTRDPILGGTNGDEKTFGLKLRAPVKRTLDSDVTLALKTGDDTSSDAKFNASEERLEKEGGGMGSKACVRGEVTRMSQFFIKDSSIFGTFAKVFKDDCFQSSDSSSESSSDSSSSTALTEEQSTGGTSSTDSSSEQGWFAAFKATKVVEE